MSRKYMEDSLNGVKNYFNDNLDNMLATIESEREEVVKRVGHISVGESRKQIFPRISILPDQTDHDYGFEDAPLTRPWLIHSIAVLIEYSSGDLSDVRKTIMRYDEAVNRLQEADSTFENAFVDVQLGTVDYTPMMEDSSTKKMMQGLSVQLTAKSY